MGPQYSLKGWNLFVEIIVEKASNEGQPKKNRGAAKWRQLHVSIL